jgi:hypothetical protein
VKSEYNEGPKARENFERLATAVFAATPKHNKGQKPKKATARKTSGKKRG